MSGLYMMATISDRNQARRFLDFYREYGLSVTLLTYGRGTAASEILDAFGLEAAEKAVIFSVVTGEEWKRLKTGWNARSRSIYREAGSRSSFPSAASEERSSLSFSRMAVGS